MSTGSDDERKNVAPPGLLSRLTDEYVTFAKSPHGSIHEDELLPIVAAPIKELNRLVPTLLKDGMPGPMDMVEGMMSRFVVGDFEDRDLSGHKKFDKYGNPIPGNPIEELANFGGPLRGYWEKAVVTVRGLVKKDNAQTEVADADVSLGGNNALPNNPKQNSQKIS